MSATNPLIQTKAEITKYSHITLAELQQFFEATAGWPRDTKVKIVSHDGQRDGYSITISATLGGCEMIDNELVVQIAKAIQVKTGGNVEGKLPDWWSEFIDMVLAELQSAGRLIPAGGMALTAEQMEDVRTVVFTKSGSDTYLLAGETVDRVRALFPATEPAEERCTVYVQTEYGDIQRELPDGHAAHHRIDPAPAEPAEEETKVELCAVRLCVLPARHSGVHADREGLRWNNPASSPVVPAPTETGPWKHRVNGEICVASSASGLPYTIGKFNDHGNFVWHSSSAELPEGFAPFVAAEEG